MTWILLIIGAVVVYSLMNKTTVSSTTPISTGIVSDTVYETVKTASANNLGTKPVDYSKPMTYSPPPGYSGPFGGPYTWASTGDPPSGLLTVRGYPIGYTTDLNGLKYIWSTGNSGPPPNGMYQMDVS